MFAVRVVGRNIMRHRVKSLLYLLVGMLTVVLFAVYAGNLNSTRRQLERLPEVMKIPARISNLNGSLEDGMTIKEERVQAIRACEYVTDVVFTVRLKVGFGAFTTEDYEGKLDHDAAGMNAIGGVPGLSSEEIIFLPGEDESALETADKVCIMDAGLMERKNLRLGDKVMLTSFYYRYEGQSYEIYLSPLVTDTYRIIGAMEIGEYLGTWAPADVILPLDCVREAYHRQGIEFLADAGSFVVKDPFHLNECKKEMQKIGMLPVISRADFSYDGNALTIMDETFVRSARTLQENLALLKGMQPFLVVIIFCIGYICSYLFIQGRQEEYALMRSLGTGRGKSFFLLLGETVLLEAAACFLGSLTAGLFLSARASVLLTSGAVFFAAFLAGTVAALLSLHRLGVMELLCRNES